MAVTRILLLNTSRPAALHGRTTPKTLRPFLPPDTEVKISWPPRWKHAIVDEPSFALAVPHIMAQVERYRGNYNAVVVNHHSDGGIEAVRAMVEVPVVGIGEAQAWTAGYLVNRFSIVTFGDGHRRLDWKIVRNMGLLDRLASIRVPHEELAQFKSDGFMGGVFDDENLPKTQEIIIGQCIKAVEEDGAQAVLLGGSPVGYLMPELASEAKRRLAERGHGEVPIIEPMSTAFHLAKMMVDLGLRKLA